MRYFNLRDFLLEATQRNVSDVMFIPGAPITVMSGGKSARLGEILMPSDTEHIVREIYTIANRDHSQRVFDSGDDNFSFTLPSVCRLRASMFRQRNSFGCMLRMIPFELPSAEKMNIPPQVMDVANCEHGLVLVAGNAGSGKTTTMAMLIREINTLRSNGLIVTLENPLEYLHRHNKCVLIQREIYTDTQDYLSGIDSALYQRPDVMMVSDIPNSQVAKALVRTAQSGKLLLSTAYGSSTVEALRNLAGLFPLNEQAGAFAVMGDVLKAMIFQCMVPDLQGALIPAFEVVGFDETLSAMLRERRLDDLQKTILASRTNTVISLDRSLVDLFRQQKISRDTVMKYAVDRNAVRRQLY